jgi:hypothetical protein
MTKCGIWCEPIRRREQLKAHIEELEAARAELLAKYALDDMWRDRLRSRRARRISQSMLAPPERRRKRKPTALRRAADRKRKRKQLAREKQDLHRIEAWISGHALVGLINQMIATKQISDRQSLDRRNVDAAIACLLEAQGKRWAR